MGTVSMRSHGDLWEYRARCGHYLLPEPCCDVEPNPPTAPCDECGSTVVFDGITFERGPNGGRTIVMFASTHKDGEADG